MVLAYTYFNLKTLIACPRLATLIPSTTTFLSKYVSLFLDCVFVFMHVYLFEITKLGYVGSVRAWQP